MEVAPGMERKDMVPAKYTLDSQMEAEMVRSEATEREEEATFVEELEGFAGVAPPCTNVEGESISGENKTDGDDCLSAAAAAAMVPPSKTCNSTESPGEPQTAAKSSISPRLPYYSRSHLGGYRQKGMRRLVSGNTKRLVKPHPLIRFGKALNRHYPVFPPSFTKYDPYRRVLGKKKKARSPKRVLPDTGSDADIERSLAADDALMLAPRAPPTYLQLLESLVAKDCFPKGLFGSGAFEKPASEGKPAAVGLLPQAPQQASGSPAVVTVIPLAKATPTPGGSAASTSAPSTASTPPKSGSGTTSQKTARLKPPDPQPCTSKQALAELVACQRAYQRQEFVDLRNMMPLNQLQSTRDFRSRLCEILATETEKKQNRSDAQGGSPEEMKEKTAPEKGCAGSLSRPDYQMVTAVGPSNSNKDSVIQWPSSGGNNALLPSATFSGMNFGPSATPTVDKILMPPPPPPRPKEPRKRRRIVGPAAPFPGQFLVAGGRNMNRFNQRRLLFRRRRVRVPKPIPVMPVIAPLPPCPLDSSATWMKADDWEVETLVGSKIESDVHTGQKNRFYLVKWKGWDEDFNEWVLEKNVLPHFVKAYWNKIVSENAVRNAYLPCATQASESAASGTPAPICYFGLNQDFAGI